MMRKPTTRNRPRVSPRTVLALAGAALLLAAVFLAGRCSGRPAPPGGRPADSPFAALADAYGAADAGEYSRADAYLSAGMVRGSAAQLYGGTKYVWDVDTRNGRLERVEVLEGRAQVRGEGAAVPFRIHYEPGSAPIQEGQAVSANGWFGPDTGENPRELTAHLALQGGRWVFAPGLTGEASRATPAGALPGQLPAGDAVAIPPPADDVAVATAPMGAAGRDAGVTPEVLGDRAVMSLSTIAAGYPIPERFSPRVERKLRAILNPPGSATRGGRVMGLSIRPHTWERLPVRDPRTGQLLPADRAISLVAYLSGEVTIEGPEGAPEPEPLDPRVDHLTVALHQRGGEWVVTDVADDGTIAAPPPPAHGYGSPELAALGYHWGGE